VFLKSEWLYLRALERSDLEFLYQLENDVQVWRVSNTVTPYSKEVLEQYLDNATADIYSTRQLRLLICSLQHEPVGVIDLFDFEPLHQRAGIGILVAENFRQQQYASNALNLILHYCQQILLLHQVYCTIPLSNSPSRQLFNQVGFISIGIRKEWLRIPEGWEDVEEFQKILVP
jgi:diamine N-acetyltransferase